MANISRIATTDLDFKQADVHPSVRNINDMSVHIAKKNRVTYAEQARFDGVRPTIISDQHHRVRSALRKPTRLFRVSCAIGADYLSELAGD